MKNINFSFPQGKFRKNDLFLKPKYKKYKRKVYEKSFIISIEWHCCTIITRMRWGGVAHSLKEVCDNPNTKYSMIEANVYYEIEEIPESGLGPKTDYLIFYDENGNKKEKAYAHPRDIIGYGIKNTKNQGQILKLKGQNPKCNKNNEVFTNIIFTE